ncbi:MAG TPA: ribonuclease H-like domain-containing protein [Chloroflexota bacterium]
MTIEAKLQNLHRQIGLPSAGSDPGRDPPDSRRGRYRLEERLPGSMMGSSDGPVFVAETTRAEDTIHGLHAFDGLRSVSAASLAMIAKDGDLEYADVSKAVFLDTETTGLGMGAGTYVFLVGAGYLDGNEFRVKQFFLTGPGHEVQFLSDLSRFLTRFSTVVTFNGKAFDLPLLENRYIRHRQRPPFVDPPHIDLLHPARRIWKRRLESCSLSSLESQILGLARSQEDVPGWEIPSRYFRYQRSGDSRELEGVFYHNLQDILSLAALLVHVDRVMANPVCGLITNGLDFLSLGKAYARGGYTDTALVCFDEALRRPMEAEDRSDCLMRMATLQKRDRRWDVAVQLWEALIDEGGEPALYGRVELSKYYEHVERDYMAALEQVQAALRVAELYESSVPDANERDLQHRLSRLLTRSMKRGDWARSLR